MFTQSRITQTCKDSPYICSRLSFLPPDCLPFTPICSCPSSPWPCFVFLSLLAAPCWPVVSAHGSPEPRNQQQHQSEQQQQHGRMGAAQQNQPVHPWLAPSNHRPWPGQALSAVSTQLLLISPPTDLLLISLFFFSFSALVNMRLRRTLDQILASYEGSNASIVCVTGIEEEIGKKPPADLNN